jgi:hypothetical protein
MPRGWWRWAGCDHRCGGRRWSRRGWKGRSWRGTSWTGHGRWPCDPASAVLPAHSARAGSLMKALRLPPGNLGRVVSSAKHGSVPARQPAAKTGQSWAEPTCHEDLSRPPAAGAGATIKICRPLSAPACWAFRHLPIGSSLPRSGRLTSGHGRNPPVHTAVVPPYPAPTALPSAPYLVLRTDLAGVADASSTEASVLLSADLIGHNGPGMRFETAMHRRRIGAAGIRRPPDEGFRRSIPM